MRTLLAKRYNNRVVEPDNDADCITSLFGSAKSDSVKAGRLLFTDMFLDNLDDLHRAGLSGATEVKYEIVLNEQQQLRIRVKLSAWFVAPCFRCN